MGNANGSSACTCNPDTCMSDPRGEHVIVNSSSSVTADGAQFMTPRQVTGLRAGSEPDPVTPREDGGLCIGDVNGNAGTIRYQNGDVYIGEWRGARAVGYGRVVRPDSSTYEGQWANDAAHGEGVEKYPDGSWYRGGYAQGMKTGFGIFQWAHGPQFCGQFDANVFHGEGSYYWGDGRIYTGQWMRNEFHGHGRMSWADGQVYDGQYLEGKKEGEGTFIWADARRFTGKWRDGKQHGTGVFYDERGGARRGEWEAGRRMRWTEDDAPEPVPDVTAGAPELVVESAAPSEPAKDDEVAADRGGKASQEAEAAAAVAP